MRDVASAAEVSVETVYALFGSKPELFQAALDVTIAGDLAPVPMASRPEFKRLGQGTRDEAIRASARMVAESHRQAAGLHRALREAAASDPSLGPVLAANEERRRSDVATGFELIQGRKPTATERDGRWALSSFEVYDLLVGRSGWSPRRYENWLVEHLSFRDH
jgi:AcrR family transcriptional regulator